MFSVIFKFFPCFITFKFFVNFKIFSLFYDFWIFCPFLNFIYIFVIFLKFFVWLQCCRIKMLCLLPGEIFRDNTFNGPGLFCSHRTGRAIPIQDEICLESVDWTSKNQAIKSNTLVEFIEVEFVYYSRSNLQSFAT